ncbi:MAG: PTS fructose transporter subunit IIC [Planctomycetes bacterium]|nr:PTS fructose transporter subunit IIC [Planctomycetota bacterium]
MIEALKKLRQYLLTGVSYVIPFIACGGIMIAFGIAFVPMTPTGPDFSDAPVLKLVLDIGAASFSLLLPVLAGYIAYAMAGKPGLVPGFVGGYLADHIPWPGHTPDHVSTGFLGALLIGLIAGWVVNAIKRVRFPKVVVPIVPILILPIASSLVVGALMLKVVGIPIAQFMETLSHGLTSLSGGNATLLAAVLGAMIAFDMGGPVNKTAFFFGAAMIKEGHFEVMGACAAAICTPPLGLGLATLLRRSGWSAEEREAGLAALAMGAIGITEGAIPFAAADPLRVVPCIMGGSMVAAIIAMLGGVGDHAPHGGPIVLPVIDNRLAFVVAILVGTLVTAIAINSWRALARARAGRANTV